MREKTLDEMARQLYDDCTSVKPGWDQLGDVTKSVWRDRAREQHSKEVDESGSSERGDGSGKIQSSLF